MKSFLLRYTYTRKQSNRDSQEATCCTARPQQRSSRILGHSCRSVFTGRGHRAGWSCRGTTRRTCGSQKVSETRLKRHVSAENLTSSMRRIHSWYLYVLTPISKPSFQFSHSLQILYVPFSTALPPRKRKKKDGVLLFATAVSESSHVYAAISRAIVRHAGQKHRRGRALTANFHFKQLRKP